MRLHSNWWWHPSIIRRLDCSYHYWFWQICTRISSPITIAWDALFTLLTAFNTHWDWFIWTYNFHGEVKTGSSNFILHTKFSGCVKSKVDLPTLFSIRSFQDVWSQKWIYQLYSQYKVFKMCLFSPKLTSGLPSTCSGSDQSCVGSRILCRNHLSWLQKIDTNLHL